MNQDPPEPTRAEPGSWPGLETALTLVNRDLTATLPDQPPLILLTTPSDGYFTEQVYVAMPDGRWHGNPVYAHYLEDLEDGAPREPEDPEGTLLSVADAAQETVTELRWQVWPLCQEHNLGLHPRPAGTPADRDGHEPPTTAPAVWWCRGPRNGECHDAAPIGELAATLPGKQRRELRRKQRRRDRRR